jgi:hypothetical protein
VESKSFDHFSVGAESRTDVVVYTTIFGSLAFFSGK